MSASDGHKVYTEQHGWVPLVSPEASSCIAEMQRRIDRQDRQMSTLEGRLDDETTEIRESMQRMSDRLSTSGRREQWVTEYELQEVRRRLLDHLGQEHGSLSLCSLVDVLIGEQEQR